MYQIRARKSIIRDMRFRVVAFLTACLVMPAQVIDFDSNGLHYKTLTKSGPVIQPVKDGEALAVGDEVIVRIVLRTDRDMEYVHMKDHRGSGTEPVNVLSRYKWQDGLGYYESTKDTASHFFIDYLPKGVYVFEYAVRVQHKGKYPTGFANIECMYAPEFNSHSENINLEVK